MTTASNWLLNWAIAYATPYLVNADYANLQSKVFFIWGTCCFVCIAFVWFMIYETKGKLSLACFAFKAYLNLLVSASMYIVLAEAKYDLNFGCSSILDIR
jgi:hypothetical protein